MRVTDDFNILANALEPYGLSIRVIPKDGNCLFRSIADQLYGAHDSSSPDGEERHMEIRKRVVEYLRKNEEAYSCFIEDDNSFEGYCESLSQWGTWGGQLEIHIISLIYEVNIMIHQANGRTWVVENFPKDTQRCCQLAFHNQDHYNSVRFMEEMNLKCPAHHTTVTIIGSLTPGSRGLPSAASSAVTGSDAVGVSQRQRNPDASRDRHVTARNACQSDGLVALEHSSNGAFWKVPEFPSHVQLFSARRVCADVKTARARCRSAAPSCYSGEVSLVSEAPHTCLKKASDSLAPKQNEERFLHSTTCDASIPEDNVSHTEAVSTPSVSRNAKAKVAWRQAKAMALKEKRLKRTQRRQERGTYSKTTGADNHQPSLKNRLHFVNGTGSTAPTPEEWAMTERRYRQRSYSAFTAKDADCAAIRERFPHERVEQSDSMTEAVSTLGLDSALLWVVQTSERPQDRGTTTSSDAAAACAAPLLQSASPRCTVISEPSACKAVDRKFITPHSAHAPSPPSHHVTHCVTLDKTRTSSPAPGNATQVLTSGESSSSEPPSVSNTHASALPCSASSTPIDPLKRSIRNMCHGTLDPSVDGVLKLTQPTLSLSLAVHRCIMTMT